MFLSPCRILPALLLAAGATLLAAPAAAQQDDAEVLRRAQLQLRQSEQERNTLRAEVSRLQAQLQQQTEALNQARAAAGQNEQAAATYQSTLNLALQKNQMAVKALRDHQQELEQLRTLAARQQQALDNLRTVADNARRNTALKEELVQLCRTRNQELYRIGSELVELYEGVGFGDVMKKREPVFQMKKVRMENLVQDYEDRLREQRVYEDTLPPSLEQQMQEALQARKAAAAPAAEAASEAQP